MYVQWILSHICMHICALGSKSSLFVWLSYGSLVIHKAHSEYWPEYAVCTCWSESSLGANVRHRSGCARLPYNIIFITKYDTKNHNWEVEDDIKKLCFRWGGYHVIACQGHELSTQNVTGYRYISTLVQACCANRLLCRHGRVLDFQLRGHEFYPHPGQVWRYFSSLVTFIISLRL